MSKIHVEEVDLWQNYTKKEKDKINHEHTNVAEEIELTWPVGVYCITSSNFRLVDSIVFVLKV